MRELRIGVRIDPHQGISFFGALEANDLIQAGGQVVAIEPGGAILEALDDEDGDKSMTLCGFSLTVKIEEA